MIGKPLEFRYGESTGIFIGQDELRIGHEPGGYRLVLSKGQGEFPIRQYLQDGKEVLFTDKAECLKIAEELEAEHHSVPE